MRLVVGISDGLPKLAVRDLLAAPEDILLIVMPPDRLDGLEAWLTRIAEAAPGAVWLAATMPQSGTDARRLAAEARDAFNAGASIVHVHRRPEFKATPEALRTHLKQQIDLWGPIIKKAGAFAD